MLNIWNDKLNPKDSHVNRYESVIKNDPNGGIFFLLWFHGFRYMAFDVFTFKHLRGCGLLGIGYLSIFNPLGFMLNIWNDKLNPKDSHVNRYELVIKNNPNGVESFSCYGAMDFATWHLTFYIQTPSRSWSCWYWFIYQYSIPWDYAEYLERQIESEGFTC